MAGRYWYLEESRTEEVVEALDAFEKSCNRSPLEIWHCLKFRGNPEHLPPYARQRIKGLIEECKKRGMYPRLKDGRTEWKPTSKQNVKTIACGTGCVIVIVLVLFLSLLGIRALIDRWMG
jgi:hypothetical protein